jgi:hypothetical protein
MCLARRRHSQVDLRQDHAVKFEWDMQANSGETIVRTIPTALAALTVMILVTMANASATAIILASDPSGSQSLAQSENPSAMSRVKQWTRANLEAAKKALGPGSGKIL